MTVNEKSFRRRAAPRGRIHRRPTRCQGHEIAVPKTCRRTQMRVGEISERCLFFCKRNHVRIKRCVARVDRLCVKPFPVTYYELTKFVILQVVRAITVEVGMRGNCERLTVFVTALRGRSEAIVKHGVI